MFPNLKTSSKDIAIMSCLIKVSGWLTLFIVDWRIGLACFIISVGDKVQRNLIDNSFSFMLASISKTQESILTTLEFLTKKEVAEIVNEAKIKEVEKN